MTEQSTSGYAPPPPPSGGAYAPPPPPGTAPPRQPLRRSPAGRRVLGGVATGLADFFGIDPILVRVGFVVLTVLSGGGIVLYLALWLFLPEEGEPDSAGERFLHNNTALAATLAVVLGLFVVAPVLAWGWWGKGPGFLGLIVTLAAAAVVVAVARRDRAPVATAPPASPGSPAGPPAGSSPEPTRTPMATTTAAATTPPTQVLPYSPPVVAVEPPASTRSGWRAPAAPEPPRPPKPPKQRSVLGPLTVSVALLVVGVLVALNLAGAASLTAVSVVSAALLVVGLGLLVGTMLGRSRGLIALGVVLVLVLVPLAAIPRGLGAGDGAGDRIYTPTSLTQLQDEYKLGAGQLTLDLSNLDFAGSTQQVDVQVGAGLITVLVPRNASATVDAQAGVGNLQLPGQPDRGGIGIDQTWSRQADGATGSLELDLQVGLGQIQVNVTRPSIDSTHAEVTR